MVSTFILADVFTLFQQELYERLLIFIYFYFLAVLPGIWESQFRQPMIEPVPPALGAQSLNHWSTREVPGAPC